MEVVHMRTHLIAAYPGPNWKKKVDRMSDNQVIAVYSRLVKEKKIKGA